MKAGALIVLLLVWRGLLFADTLTLTSGETLTGAITATTNGTYWLRIANADFSIVSVRIVATNEITAVVRDTPEQHAARADYESICQYRLQADREQSAAQCAQIAARLQQFLHEHPDNPVAPRVQEQLTMWTDELAHVSRGEVKFQNRWLVSPAAKAAAVRAAAQQARLQADQIGAEKLRKQIAKDEVYRASVAKLLTGAERDLANAEQFLAGLHDRTELVYGYRPTSGYPQPLPRNGYTVWTPPLWTPYVNEEKVIVNPQRADAEKRVQDCQNSVADYRTELAGIDQRLIDLRAQLIQTEATLAKATDNPK